MQAKCKDKQEDVYQRAEQLFSLFLSSRWSVFSARGHGCVGQFFHVSEIGNQNNIDPLYVEPHAPLWRIKRTLVATGPGTVPWVVSCRLVPGPLYCHPSGQRGGWVWTELVGEHVIVSWSGPSVSCRCHV